MIHPSATTFHRRAFLGKLAEVGNGKAFAAEEIDPAAGIIVVSLVLAHSPRLAGVSQTMIALHLDDDSGFVWLHLAPWRDLNEQINHARSPYCAQFTATAGWT
jgi:hypothetical protein